VESDVGQGLDRVNLTQLRNRFMALNTQRMQRLQQSLLPPQRAFIDLLPLLFHVNHPSLPGYCGTDVPAGIRNFRLNNQQIKSARKLSSSFALQRDINPELNICGLYFMGSCSSVTHNSRSDLDVWVCPSSHLTEQQVDALRRKCQLINEWAQTLRLETHFFIMDANAFKQGERSEMTDDDCGTTQHYLLLDEFYRTSIVVAGCTPLWWYVPASFENDYESYAQTLLTKRYLKEFNCIDFGSPGQLPANEFISAGVWQLYKGIANPDKALLKLMLLEVYASEYPHTCNLSTQFKAKIYKAEAGDDELDPYLQIYRRIESYLQDRNETDRLELLRRCLYIKAGIALSTIPDDLLENNSPDEFIRHRLSSPQHWKRALMHTLVAEWGWKRSKLLELDNRQNWSFSQCRAEQHKLTKELVHSYQMLSALARSTEASGPGNSGGQKGDNNRLLNILGRQLYAAFEHKPNKLQQLTSSIVKSLAQPSLVFRATGNAEQQIIWSLFDDDTADSVKPLKQAEDPAQLLSWAIVNGLINSDTRFKVDAASDLTEYEIKQLAGPLSGLLPVRNRGCNTEDPNTQFSKPAYVTDCVVIANCGVDPLQSDKLEGIWRLTDKVDPLVFTELQESLVVRLTLIEVNSWGEVYCHNFSGPDALDQYLCHYFNYADKQQSLPTRRFLCACPTRPDAIRLRLSTLADDIERCFDEEIGQCLVARNADPSSGQQPKKNPASRKLYVFESACGFHLLRWTGQGLDISLLGSEERLLQSLGGGENTGRLVLDSSTLQKNPLCAINRTLEARSKSSLENAAVCIFYEVQGSTARVYLSDTEGSLAFAELPYEGMRSLIMPIRKFVAQSEARRASISPSATRRNSGDQMQKEVDIACYVLQESFGEYAANPVPTESNISASILSIKATGIVDTTGEICWSIACDEQIYEQSILGDSMFNEVAQAIVQYRENNQTQYRCYITDIEVQDSLQKHSSLVRDFNYKNVLEQRLNAAYEALLQ